MVSKRVLLMKIYFILIISLLYGCQNQTEHLNKEFPHKVNIIESTQTVITDTLYVNTDSITIQTIGGKGLYKGELFTGYAAKFFENNQPAEKVFYLNGKKEGIAKYWFENGTIRKTKNFAHNRLNGRTIIYFENGQKASLRNYLNNKLDGIQEEWYENGKIFKRQNCIAGKEEGLQQAWTRNGKIFANYEARNGRIFGLKRTNLCVNVKDEIISLDE